jgi:hypothetical protein
MWHLLALNVNFRVRKWQKSIPYLHLKAFEGFLKALFSLQSFDLALYELKLAILKLSLKVKTK